MQLAGEFFHARRRDDLEADRHGVHLDIHFVVVQIAFAQPFAQHLAGIGSIASVVALGLGRRQQNVENAILGGVLGTMLHALHRLFAEHLHGDIHQIADDRLHIPAHVAHLGELGGFHLDERGVGQPCQTAGDLRFADAGRPDHEDVLGRDFVAQFIVQLHPPPAVAQRNRHRALGVVLADDVLVEFVDDFARGHQGHSVSMVV